MFDVQHFVKHHVFGDTQRDVGRVEQPAYEDGAVRLIESAEHVSRFLCRPRQPRLRQHTLEILMVQAVEDLVQVEITALNSSRPRVTAPITPRSASALLNGITEDEVAISPLV